MRSFDPSKLLQVFNKLGSLNLIRIVKEKWFLQKIQGRFCQISKIVISKQIKPHTKTTKSQP